MHLRMGRESDPLGEHGARSYTGARGWWTDATGKVDIMKRAIAALLLGTAILAGCGEDTTPRASMLPMVNKAGQIVLVPRALANLLGSAAANQVPVLAEGTFRVAP